MKKGFFISAIGLLLAAAVIDWIRQPVYPAEFSTFNLDAFRHEFNRHTNQTRMIVLLSPT